jgi:dihydroxyacid dehydratase/phosphogluconate dehydratase
VLCYITSQTSDKVPFLADLKPSGKYVMEDVQKIGGTPAVMKVHDSLTYFIVLVVYTV